MIIKKALNIHKVISHFKRILYKIKSKKISKILKKILPKDKIQIYDIGAGLRYLPTLLKFDRISQINLIDPNENLEISYQNLKRLFSEKRMIKKFKIGLSDKNKILNYYPARVSSGSSFIDLKKKLKIDSDYFGNEKKILKKVYDFQTFKKKFRLKNPDIVKIDVEGLEIRILKSILKKDNPLIIEVELNFDNSIIGDTFSKANKLIKTKNYKLITIYPTYEDLNKNGFLKGDYHNPISRNSLNQCDCYYLLKKKEYSVKDIIMMVGYGFIDEANKNVSMVSKKLTDDKFNELKKLIKNLM